VTKEMDQSGTGIPPEIRKLFGPPPVLSTEDAKAYEEMLSRLAQCLQLGGDFIEILLAKTVINLTWEKLRYVQFKKGLIELARHKRLLEEAKDIEAVASFRHSVQVTQAELARKPVPEREDETSQIKAVLDRPPTMLEHVQAMQDCLDEYERLDKLDIAVDMRLRAALCDFERYRDGLGRQLRQAVGQVIDGEVNELAASANAAVSPKEIPVALVERAALAPEASNSGASAAVEASDPLVAVAPADEVSIVPAGVSAWAMAVKLGTGHAASDSAVLDVVDDPVALGVAEPSAAMAADPDTGHLAAEIVSPRSVGEPTAATPIAAAESADADLEPNTVSMSPGIINAHNSVVSVRPAPEAVDLLLPAADAQVPPGTSGAP
jgi:hypothetical protein